MPKGEARAVHGKYEGPRTRKKRASGKLPPGQRRLFTGPKTEDREVRNLQRSNSNKKPKRK